MAVLTYPLRRVPAFHPVPLRKRRDGWTAGRQVVFIGLLMQYKSVARAATGVRMSREGAYRLRTKPGAEEFTAVWDMIMARNAGAMVDMAQVARAARKFTPGLLWDHAQTGLVRPLMYRGKLISATRKADNSAVLQYLAQLDRTIGDKAY
ncbi:MAG: hypothetical protein WA908_03240 [Pontixanthobacter sp.]